MEASKGPLGQMAAEGEVYRGGFGFPRVHQGRVHQHQEKASGEERGLACLFISFFCLAVYGEKEKVAPY